ncbi:MAG: DUF3473 domain-containing protein [Bacteroidetes bacterium]|nr:DUF3473 domain-containing protein [Bacteroidota bacterium]
MKKLFTILTVFSALILMANTFAQSRYLATDSWAFGFGFTYPRYISINDAVVQSSDFYGGHLTIQKNVSEHVGVRFRTSYNHVVATYQVAPKRGEDVSNNMITAEFGFLFYFAPCEPWSPYVLAGSGINYYKPENTLATYLDNEYTLDGQFIVGAGSEIRVGENWRVKLEVDYNMVWSSNIDGNPGPSNGLIGGTANDTWVNADVGLIYYFSKGEPSKICQLYTGIAEVDYNQVEDIVRRYQTEPTEIDYNRIEDIVKRGHEISSHGYSHTDIRKMNRSSFEEDLQKSLVILKKLSGENILGFRAPYFSVTKENFWVFDVLKKYLKYDSSIFPVRTSLYGIPDAPRSIYRLSDNNPLENDDAGNFIEIPLATLRLSYFGNLPVAGGFYLRFLPLWIIKTGIKKLNKSRFPAVCFIHPHDLDPEKPRVVGYHWRAYWGLKGASKKFESLLSTFSFSSVRETLLH